MASLTAFVSQGTLARLGASGLGLDGRRPSPQPSSLFPAGSVADLRVTNGEDLQAASFGWDVRYAQGFSGTPTSRAAWKRTW